jgi:hypothetical protein
MTVDYPFVPVLLSAMPGQASLFAAFRTLKPGGGLATFRKFSLHSANTLKALYLQYVERYRLPFSASFAGNVFSTFYALLRSGIPSGLA